MHSPDLIQRIYFEKEKGDESNFFIVQNDLRTHNFDFISEFDFEDRKIYWTCFESKRYCEIIDEREEYIYFYLWEEGVNFEVVIPGHTYKDELNKPLLERTPFFHSIWVLGLYFPGLESVSERPIKIRPQYIRRMDYGPIRKLNYWLKKMLSQYKSLSRPIFKSIDYPRSGNSNKLWVKLVDKRK